ncbi:MAG: hypothetical protein ACK4R8_07800 [Thiobacillus sp.]
MNRGCRIAALFPSPPVAADARQAGRRRDTVSVCLRLALPPGALWLYLRCSGVPGCRRCEGRVDAR